VNPRKPERLPAADVIAVRPVGVVRSPWPTRDAVPLEGGAAVIEVYEAFAPALQGIERASHLVVLAWMHRADRSALVARPRRLDPAAPACGVFASRSPARPNPVGMTVVPLLRREGRFLDVDALDLMDGTPVLDLKAYNPGWDAVAAARLRRRVRPDALPPSLLRAFLRRELESCLGQAAAGDGARTALAAVHAAVRHFGVDARDPRLSVAVNRLDVVTDALAGLTGATFSGGRLAASPAAGPLVIEFACEGRSLRLVDPEPAPPGP
jgi:tRNA-Thr(GGU) m(6)t(6)A37 methyltransferase TsaA